MAIPVVARWRNFATGDGLPTSLVRFVLEDREENLWFGTSGGGVSRFDGVTWKTFTMADSVPGNLVTSIFEDRSGTLWIGTDRGVGRHDGSGWSSIGVGGLPSDDVMAITQDRAGILWFATSGGVCRRDTLGNWLPPITAPLASNFIRDVLEDRHGGMWFATFRGVNWTNGTNWQTFLDGYDVSMILEDREGNLWFTVRGVGAARRDTLGNWGWVTATDGLPSNDVMSVFQDRSGFLWFGTPQGIGRFDGRLWRTFHELDGLPIHTITQDRSGNLWFANTGGATRFDGEDLQSFSDVVGLSSDVIYSVMEDDDGSVWLGSDASGAFRFDGVTWHRYAAPDSLPGNTVLGVIRDRARNLWFPCYGYGVRRRDSTGGWTSYTIADGLASDLARWCFEDRNGTIWVVLNGGVGRFDDPGWTSFTTVTTAGGLAGNDVYDVTEDHAGNLWFSTTNGVSRRDTRGNWQTFRIGDGLAANHVFGVFEDRDHSMWFATYGAGASRRDSLGNWRTVSGADGLANDFVLRFMQDRAGNLWFAHDRGGGVTRFDGSTWRNLGVNDGLPNSSVAHLLEDRAGRLWLATYRGVHVYEPDVVPPRTVLPAVPAPVSAAKRQTAVFGALGESDRLEFSYRLDGEVWSGWSSSAAWSHDDLDDGLHRLEVRARDYWTNVDRTPAIATFEIDATAPEPVIASPRSDAVRGVVVISGTAVDERFARYGVTVRPVGASSWTALTESTLPVADGPLATWDTTAWPDGGCEVRLAVEDTLGLTASTLVTVRVDNHVPFDTQTAPARVSAATGGDVYTLNGELHLYFPPHAFEADARVTIDPVPPDSVPYTLPSGATRVTPGFALGWQGAALEKPSRLDLSLAAVASQSSGSLAIYHSADTTNWQRLGGTVEGDRIALTVSAEGRYALFAGGAAPGGEQGLSNLSFTPRVFSPSGTYGDRRVGIAFTLGQPGTVNVRVYNRAGRQVREVVRNAPLGAGSNLVWWDGRDREGGIVVDGLYLVTVEALGETRSHTLAVVR